MLLKKILIALFIAITPLSAVAESEAYVPPPEWVRHMMKNLDDDQYREIVMTEPLVVQLKKSVLSPEKEGMIATFFFWKPNFRWQMAEKRKRTDAEGLIVTVWEFALSNPDAVLTFESQTGVWDGRMSPFKILTPDSPEWTNAMEKSRKTWKMLCEAFPCSPSI
ncbi:MAG: hypothetical protein Q8R25_03195 [bacterium]|nr:hypothetical protein [bacterium]